MLFNIVQRMLAGLIDMHMIVTECLPIQRIPEAYEMDGCPSPSHSEGSVAYGDVLDE
jgi:hypothetical protein